MSEISTIGRFAISVTTSVKVLKIKDRIYVDLRKEDVFGEKRFPTKRGVCLNLREFEEVIEFLKDNKEIANKKFSETRSISIIFTSFGGAMLILEKMDKGKQKQQVMDLTKEELLELIYRHLEVNTIITSDELNATFKSITGNIIDK